MLFTFLWQLCCTFIKRQCEWMDKQMDSSIETGTVPECVGVCEIVPHSSFAVKAHLRLGIWN